LNLKVALVNFNVIIRQWALSALQPRLVLQDVSALPFLDGGDGSWVCQPRISLVDQRMAEEDLVNEDINDPFRKAEVLKPV
jgi:hypothetical protein